MKLNDNTLKGKWREIKGNVQKTWGKLTDDELDKTKGDMKAISGIIQQKYGEAQKSSSEKLSKIFKSFEDTKDESLEKVKDKLKK
jgi:uncharacterized protein YjbJ (UPF0337 family)